MHFEFRAAHAKAGFEEINLILAVADRKIGLGLLDLLVDLVDLELRFLETGAALGVVEFDDEVFVVRQRTQGAILVTWTVPKRLGAERVAERTARSSPREYARITTSPRSTLAVGTCCWRSGSCFNHHVATPRGPQHEQQDQ